ncbi:MAG: hypothetical protein M1828_000111 [Chrysothrix sp. TS-e1954]|nr:MAG: hypothetical protein M1828_000111 [Chrysothrix sp. TS-e1954]
MEKAYSAWVPIVRVLEDIYEFLLQDPYGVIGESPEDTRTKVRSNDLLSTCNNYFHGIQYRVDTGKLEWEELEVIVAYFGDWADSLDGWLTPLRLELEGRQGPWDTYEDTFAESDMPMAFELDEAFCKRIADFSNEMRVFTLMTCVTHLERKELVCAHSRRLSRKGNGSVDTWI